MIYRVTKNSGELLYTIEKSRSQVAAEKLGFLHLRSDREAHFQLLVEDVEGSPVNRPDMGISFPNLLVELQNSWQTEVQGLEGNPDAFWAEFGVSYRQKLILVADFEHTVKSLSLTRNMDM